MRNSTRDFGDRSVRWITEAGKDDFWSGQRGADLDRPGQPDQTVILPRPMSEEAIATWWQQWSNLIYTWRASSRRGGAPGGWV